MICFVLFELVWGAWDYDGEYVVVLLPPLCSSHSNPYFDLHSPLFRQGLNWTAYRVHTLAEDLLVLVCSFSFVFVLSRDIKRWDFSWDEET